MLKRDQIPRNVINVRYNFLHKKTQFRRHLLIRLTLLQRIFLGRFALDDGLHNRECLLKALKEYMGYTFLGTVRGKVALFPWGLLHEQNIRVASGRHV